MTSRRFLSASTRRNSAVSDLYIEQIKAFKPTPLSSQEASEAVKKFQLPQKPSVPAEEISADSLGKYESSEVETETKSSSGEAITPEEDWFVFEEEEEHH